MKLKSQIKTVAGIAASALVIAGPGAADGGLDGARDYHETAALSGEAAIAYFRANERATIAQPVPTGALDAGLKGVRDYHESGTTVLSPAAAVAYFRANEGVTLAQPMSTGTSQVAQIEAADASGFDWGSAAIGATSVLMLALLIGVSLVTTRRFRGGQLSH
jgi:hypothetical protein